VLCWGQDCPACLPVCTLACPDLCAAPALPLQTGLKARHNLMVDDGAIKKGKGKKGAAAAAAVVEEEEQGLAEGEEGQELVVKEVGGGCWAGGVQVAGGRTASACACVGACCQL
jgi:hypothetical protein